MAKADIKSAFCQLIHHALILWVFSFKVVFTSTNAYQWGARCAVFILSHFLLFYNGLLV